MALKPALYYAVVSDGYGGRFKAVAVTSEKSRRWYGRECTENTATNGSLSHIKRKFDTQEKAEAVISDIQAIHRKHAPLIQAANAALSAAWRAEADEIKAFNANV